MFLNNFVNTLLQLNSITIEVTEQYCKNVFISLLKTCFVTFLFVNQYLQYPVERRKFSQHEDENVSRAPEV